MRKEMVVMSDNIGKEDEKEEEPVETIKQKCFKCLKGANLIKSMVVLVCTAVVAQQISVCVMKLINVPITTYTHFDFNKTILYPSLTFCREPPYKFQKMMEYGLYAHPRFTTTWRGFNFSAVDLDQTWRDITYEPGEVFAQYGLNGLMENVEVHTYTGFIHGRCFTLNPRVLVSQASRDTGYSVTLQHHTADVATSTSVHPPGYHMFVHYTREPFTEVQVYNGGLVDYVYINTGETLDVKLTVDQYIKISDEEDPCSNAENYSANHCTSERVWAIVEEESGCSGPWMSSHLPRCRNYSSMKDLITSYMNTYNVYNAAACPRFCRAFLYNAYVTERQRMYTWDTAALKWTVKVDDAELQSQLYVHFNSMMISVYEESYNYDWNIFIADLGGSVGFLLGLSVIGLMTIVAKMWYTLISPFCKTSKAKKNRSKRVSVTSSTVTAQVENVYRNQTLVNNKLESYKNEDLFKKCNDWQAKNLRDI